MAGAPAAAVAAAGAFYVIVSSRFRNRRDESEFIKIYADGKTRAINYLAFVLRPSRLQIIANMTAGRNIEIARPGAIY